MTVKLANEVILKTKNEVIRVGNSIKLIHKDGRPIRGKLMDIKGEMIYVNDEVIHLCQIEENTLYKLEVN